MLFDSTSKAGVRNSLRGPTLVVPASERQFRQHQRESLGGGHKGCPLPTPSACRGHTSTACSMLPTAPLSSNSVPTVVATPSGPYSVSDRIPTHSPSGTRYTCTARSVLRKVYFVMSIWCRFRWRSRQSRTAAPSGSSARPEPGRPAAAATTPPPPGAIGFVSHSHSVLCRVVAVELVGQVAVVAQFARAAGGGTDDDTSAAVSNVWEPPTAGSGHRARGFRRARARASPRSAARSACHRAPASR